MKKNKRQQCYWDIVNGKNLYEERLSITLFGCLELQYLCYDKGLSARHYDQDESDSDDDALISIEEEEEERQWDALPDIPLLNIFCKSELKDRLESFPLVCKSWKTVTDDPRCWSSMMPDSVSPEYVFIKKTGYWCLSDYLPFKYSRRRLEEGKEEVPVGLKRLRTLIKKSGGGAAITSLCLSPFWYWADSREEANRVMTLITNCCPNLKHISFDGYPQLSMEALLLLVKTCKKLELMDLAYFNFGYHHKDLSDIQQLLCCLPNLRGLRIFECKPYTSVVIATHLPQLSLLCYDSYSLTSEDLSTILCNCLELQYLHVEGPEDMLCRDILDQASAQIPEFYYESYYESPRSTPEQNSYHDDDSDWQKSRERELIRELNCFEDPEDPYETDYFFIDYYDDIIVKHRKEKKEYHYSMYEF